MAKLSVDELGQLGKRVLTGLIAIVAGLMLLLSLLWRDRVDLDDIPLDPPPAAAGDAVAVTWFGVTTLLIDDGETQILIDGFISRPTLLDVLRQRPVNNDAATINYFLNEYRVRRLAAIIPVHSHFDHAMDIGAIANRSSASILGTSSTAMIAAGSGVPEDQVVVVDTGVDYSFGQFTVRFVESAHAPVGWRGTVPLAGEIEEPLSLPAPVTAWREGGSFSIVLTHPQGTAIIQGSAGMPSTLVEDVAADTVLLGVGLLEGLGRDYVERYWNAMVTSTGARMVLPIHFDDYTAPFGTIRLAPDALDDFEDCVEMLISLRDVWDADTQIYLPRFGEPAALFPTEPAPEETMTWVPVTEDPRRSAPVFADD